MGTGDDEWLPLPRSNTAGHFFAVNSSDPYRAPRVAALAVGDARDRVAPLLFVIQLPGI